MALRDLLCILLILCSLFTFTCVISNNNQALTPNQHIKEQESEILSNRGTPRAWRVDELMGGIGSSEQALDQLHPAVISDKNQYLYCVWQDDRNLDWNIYFTKSANSGDTWSNNMKISNYTQSQGHQRYPKIAYNPNNISKLYVVWQDERTDDGDIYFSYSINRGETWANETLINSETPKDTSQWNPAIACDQQGNIYVVWSDNYKNIAGQDKIGDWNIKLSSSKDNGKTWSTPILVNDPYLDGIDQLSPDIEIDGKDMIYVTWEDNRNDEKQIFMSKSTDQGISFSNDIQVSPSKSFTTARDPDIYIDKYDNVFIVWLEDDNSQYNVYFTRSLDGGISFSSCVRVNEELNKCQAEANPSIIVDGRSNIYVAWTDQRLENHIYIGQSIDNGKSFSVNEKVDDADNSSATGISETTEEQLYRGQSNLVLLKNKLFIFWMDYRNDPNPDDAQPDNGDIYFDWNYTNINRIPPQPQFNQNKITKGWWYINLSWHISQELDFLEYRIYKSIFSDITPDISTLNATIKNRYQNYLNISGLAHATTYYFLLLVEDQFGSINISSKLVISTKANIPPAIGVVEPDGNQDLVDTSFDIIWWANDPDDNATITLYYDDNHNPDDDKHLIIEVPWGEDGSKDTYTWDTTNISNGSYLILAYISDPVNTEDYVYSPGELIIYHGNQDPWLVALFISPKNITGVGLNEPVVVIFNKALSMDTVTQNSFKVTDSLGNPVDGEFEYDKMSNKLLFNPTEHWAGSEKYYVNLTSIIRDKSKIFKLGHEYSWWFITEEEIIENGTIQGKVIDEYLKNPVTGASVTLKDLATNDTWIITTDSTGQFIFQKKPYGLYELKIESTSFQGPVKKQVDLNRDFLDVNSFELIRPTIIEFEIPTKVTVDETLKVSAKAIHPNNESLSYIWDFGDNTAGAGPSATHKYNKPGTYIVTLTVVDSNGGRVTRSETVNVEEAKDTFWNSFFILIIIGVVIGILVALPIVIFVKLLNARKRKLEELELADERVAIEEEEEKEEEQPELEPKPKPKHKTKKKKKMQKVQKSKKKIKPKAKKKAEIPKKSVKKKLVKKK